MLSGERRVARQQKEAGHGWCSTCEKKLPVEVLHSAGGYYIGTFCDTCGPYSRISSYYPTLEKAQQALMDGSYNRAVGGSDD